MSSEMAKTTKRNLRRRLSGIDFDTLPATLPDAILVARSLTIDYIWIDVLYIVQDSYTE